MKGDYLISVIMPVYNSSRFLASAIDSILSQSSKMYQVLLIDDGSTDDSSSICDKYAEKYDCITVVHKKNGGICDARNCGMQFATGDYLYFMDNDDTIASDFFETITPMIKNTEIDLIMFGTRMTDVVGGIAYSERVRSLQNFKIESKEELKPHIHEILQEGMHRCVWDKLYRREFLLRHHAQFDKSFTHGGEDLCFNTKLLPHVTKMVNVDRVFYNYYIRDDQSTFRKFNPQIYSHSMCNIKNIDKMLRDMGLSDDDYLDRLYIEYRQRLILMMLHKNANMLLKEKVAFCKKEYKNDGYSLRRRIHALRVYCSQKDISLNKKVSAAMNIAGLYALQMMIFKRRIGIA